MSKPWRSIIGLGMIGISIWLIYYALWGSFLYTTQGDVCSKLFRRTGCQISDRDLGAVDIACVRQNTVYGAFLAEVGSAIVLLLPGTRILFVSRRKLSNGNSGVTVQ